MTPSPAKLRSNLAAQATAATELERLAGDERRALDGRDWPAVQALAAAKQTAVQRMQNLMRDLRTQAGDCPLSDVLSSAGLGTAWDELLAQASRLLHANREVRARLDAHQASATAALKLVRPGVELPTYGRDGRAGLCSLTQKLARA